MELKIIFALILMIQTSFSDDINDLLKPRLVGNNINYSILVNMEQYIENDNNLDGREIFSSLDDLSDKKIGVLKGNVYDQDKYKNTTIYNTTENIFDDLRKHKIDGAIMESGVGKYIEAFSLDLSHFDESFGLRYVAYGFQKDDTKYINEMNDFLDYFRGPIGSRKSDYGYDDEASTLDDLKGENGTINVTFRLDVPPYAYKLNGDIVGGEILFIYTFAQKYGYKINLIEAQTIDEQVELLKNKTCNIAGGVFPILDEYKSEIAYSNYFRRARSNMVIRYDNAIPGNTSNKIYNSIDDFDGDPLASLNVEYYQNLTKSNFPNSNITTIDNFYDIYTSLLLEETYGCLLEKPIVDYFVNRYPERVTFYPKIFELNNYSFGFQRNEEGEILSKQFNEFLSKTDIDALYYKWTHTKTKLLNVDTNLNTSSEKIINVAIIMDFIPLCFYHFEEPKGYEVELIYLFAKEYNYQINFIPLDNDSQRMSYLTEGKANITGGHFTITEERNKSIIFAEPTLKTSTVFSVRTDSKNEFLTNIVLDDNYEEKPNNNIDFKAKFSNITKNASCFFPKKFNNTILVNCTIYNITENNPYYEGFEYKNFSGKIKFMYYSFNSETLFKSDELLSNNASNYIITETNKSLPLLTKVNSLGRKNNRYKSKNGLSAGGIVAIVIASVVAVAAVIGITMILRRSTTITPSDTATSSISILK